MLHFISQFQYGLPLMLKFSEYNYKAFIQILKKRIMKLVNRKQLIVYQLKFGTYRHLPLNNFLFDLTDIDYSDLDEDD